MNKKPLFSIIIPVYNEGEKLRKSIESALLQDCDDGIEIIVINDGSSDKITLDLLDEYKSRKGIEIIHKANGGVSSARNAGIDRANGMYIIFLDADDHIENDTCSAYGKLIEKENPADIILTNYIIDDETNGTEIPVNCIFSDEIFYDNSEKAAVKIFDKTIFNNRGCYKADTIKRKEIRYREDIEVSEDLDFVLRVMFASKVIRTSSIVKYHYHLYRKHTSLSFNRYKSQIIASREWIDELRNGKFENDTRDHFSRIFSEMMCVYYLMIMQMNSETRGEALQVCKENIKYLKAGGTKSRLVYRLSKVLGINATVNILGRAYGFKYKNSIR